MSDETVYVFWCATCGGPAAHDTEDHDRLTENLADPTEATPTHCANCGAEVTIGRPHKVGECSFPSEATT